MSLKILERTSSSYAHTRNIRRCIVKQNPSFYFFSLIHINDWAFFLCPSIDTYQFKESKNYSNGWSATLYATLIDKITFYGLADPFILRKGEVTDWKWFEVLELWRLAGLVSYRRICMVWRGVCCRIHRYTSHSYIFICIKSHWIKLLES